MLKIPSTITTGNSDMDIHIFFQDIAMEAIFE